jgi:hypothetical protein
MEYLLEIIVVAQCAVVLWLSYTIRDLDTDLENVIDAHNRLSTAFVDIMTAITNEGEYDD